MSDAKASSIPSPIARSLPVLAASPIVLYAALAFAFFLAFFINLHSIPLLDVDEGAFSEATREMLARSDFVTTYLNGNLRFDKPILIYWLQALSAWVLGINELAFRLPSALASIGWMAAIAVFTRQQSDRESGFVAALIGTTTLGINVIGRAAIADALLNLFLVLSMFDIYRYMESENRKCRYRVYLWMGLGLLTKGPIALLIPFAVSAIVFFLHGKRSLWWKAISDPVGWAILLVVAAPWYVLEYLQQGQAFIDGFFLRHNVERFRNPMQGHSGNFLYYLPALLLLLLPHSGLFTRSLSTLKAFRQNPLITFLWTWFLFVLVFFSFAGTKLPHYLIYGLSPLFILMALQRHRLQSAWLAFTPPILFLCFVMGLPKVIETVRPRMSNVYFREMLSQQGIFDQRYYLFAALLLLAALTLTLAKRIEIWLRLAAMGYLCTAAIVCLALPRIVEMQQGPVKEAAALAKRSGAPITRWQIHMPSFSVYLGNITPMHEQPIDGEIIFTRIDRMESLGPVETLYRKGGIALVRQRKDN